MVKIKKDAASFIEFLNAISKYEKKALINFPLNGIHFLLIKNVQENA